METKEKLLSILKTIKICESEIELQVNRCFHALSERNWIKLGSSSQILNHIQKRLNELKSESASLRKTIEDENRELL